MRTNLKVTPVFTHEGAKASRITPIQELRRTVLACLLWEDGFYESGEAVADRIKRLVQLCTPDDVAALAIEAREKQKLRHAPLKLVRELARTPSRCRDGLIADTLSRVIQRADELPEFLSMYWNGDGKKPIAKQVKKGLARAFRKFDEYALAKYNRDAAIKLRDVLFMVHAKPINDEQAALWKRLVEGKLETPDTWEVALSGGANKREAFERLMLEGKLGALAFLRNLRNMHDAGVTKELVSGYASALDVKRVLPFRFIAAARAVPTWEDMLEPLMLSAVAALPKLAGRTVLAVDVSGSMSQSISAKSDMNRLDAAAALAILLREVCEDFEVLTFNNAVRKIAPRRGFALSDAIGRPQGGTDIGLAVQYGNAMKPHRLIVLTDEQSHTTVGKPIAPLAYMVNVATNKNGVGYGNGWQHIDGWSEAVVQYIAEIEKEQS